MAYSSTADLLALVGTDELVQLTDPERFAVDQAKIDAAIATADATIDGILRGAGYTLPLSSSALAQVRPLSRDVALYNLYGTAVSEDSSVWLRYKDARRTLDQIASGTVALDVGENAATEAPTAPMAGGPSLTYTDAYLGNVL